MLSTARRMHDASSITGKMETTREGFLICRDVPLARTGMQTYRDYELPHLPARNGQVIAQRDAEEVFHPEAIESFRGKPLTDDHPEEDVGPRNFKRHIIGTVMSPRRGTGAHADCVVGDLIVYDAKSIEKIRAGKRELSCGYDADYAVVEPGKARQIGIRGNHVSLVDEGRCGPTCAIRDKKAMQHRDCGPSCSCRTRRGSSLDLKPKPPPVRKRQRDADAKVSRLVTDAKAATATLERMGDNLDRLADNLRTIAERRRAATRDADLSALARYRGVTPAEVNAANAKRWGRR